MVKRIKRKKVKQLKRPRFGPARTTGRLNPGTRSTGAHGSRRRIYESDPLWGITTSTTTTTTTTTTLEFGARYNMEVENFAITGNMTGQDFSYAYDNRSHIGAGDVMVFTAQDTPRLEADGVLFESRGGNILLQSRNLTTSPWNEQLGGEIAQDAVGVDGVANKAWTIGDANNSGYSYLEQLWDIGTHNENFAFSIFIEKDADTSRFPEFLLNCIGVSTQSLRMQFNTMTGATYLRVDDYPDTNVEVISYTDFWRLKISFTDDGNNNQLRLQIYPAITTSWQSIEASAQGEIVVDCLQLEIGLPYLESPIGTSYINNDGVAQGAEDCSDPGCDVGNFTMGTGWIHFASRYQASGAVGDLIDPGVLTVGKLYRVESVWSNISGGGMRIDLGNSQSPTITANGTYVHYLIAGTTDIRFDRVATFTGWLESCSVTEYGNARRTEESLLRFDAVDRYDMLNEQTGAQDPVDQCLADNTADWTLVDCTLIFDTDHYEINYVTGVDQYAYLPHSSGFTPGSLYKIVIMIKDGLTASVPVAMRMTDASHNILGCDYDMVTTGSWVVQTCYAVAEVGATGIEIYSEILGFPGNIEIKNLIVSEVTNARDSGTGVLGNHGTAIIWLLPSFDRDDGGDNNYLNSHGGIGGEMIYTDFPSQPNPTAFPGGTRANVTLDFNKDTWIKLMVQWGYIDTYELKYRVGYDDVIFGVVWGTEQVYDGNWRWSTDLIIGRAVENPFHIKRVLLYDSILTDGDIDALPAPDA